MMNYLPNFLKRIGKSSKDPTVTWFSRLCDAVISWYWNRPQDGATEGRIWPNDVPPPLNGECTLKAQGRIHKPVSVRRALKYAQILLNLTNISSDSSWALAYWLALLGF
jgi:hypothetical protein